ncbi:unnamed protein product [Heligmosomoides polygyrus]|uniref:Uncharacterized protein n=1 Tax=Heligmosomoides polygyrus TaxID=6339 RepID=A0A183FM56_HELPZ|nr:unnamed protein product [Heligmosomoides polygyrus]
MSADGRVVIRLLTLKCGPSLDKESSRKEIKLAGRMASILKDFETRQLEVDEDEQLEVVEEEEEGWDPQDELMDVERQASSGHMITFSSATLVLEERVRLQGFRTPRYMSPPLVRKTSSEKKMASLKFFITLGSIRQRFPH